MERKCKQCKQIKDIQDFPEYVVKGKRGYRYMCKVCWQAQWGSIWRKHLNRYYDTNHAGIRDKAKARSRNTYRKNPQKTYQSNALYRERHPERAKARREVLVALRSGRLVRQPCEECGNPKTDAHHEDYSKPLEVRWLCRFHHGERQRQINRDRRRGA